MRFAPSKLATALLACGLSLGSTGAMAADPYEKPDDSWISLTGTVALAGDNAFTLDYGDGLITVEMDDWDWFQEGKLLLDGDKVTVYGEIDADLYENRTIEASSVYVDSLNTYYYANDADEEDAAVIATYAIPVVQDDSWVHISGIVNSIDGREFELKTGDSEITVDTIGMGYNPLDDIGYQQIDKGDYVSVSGLVDNDLFEELEIVAETVTTLNRDETKQSGG